MQKVITLADVKANKGDKIYYSSRTIWWTDDPKDLQGTGLPLDIFDAPLFEAPKEDYFKQALQKPEHYGKNGHDTFMYGHHKNLSAMNYKDVPKYRFATWDYADAQVTEAKKEDATFTLIQ